MGGNESDLLLDIFGFKDFVEVLDADLAAGTGCVGRIVGPSASVNTPAIAVVLLLNSILHTEAAHEHDLTSGFSEGGNLWFGEPPLITFLGVVIE